MTKTSPKHAAIVRLPSTKFRRNATLLLVYTIVLVSSAAYLGFDPRMFVREFDHMVDLADRAIPPNLPILWKRPAIYTSLAQTISMAFLGTIVGGSIALGFALLAAKISSPYLPVRIAARGLLAAERAVPPFVILLVTQVAVGFGPFSSALAIGLGTIGTFGRLFADSMESVEKGPAESLAAIGASHWQRIRFAILPAAMPAIIANWLYAYDINLRHAIALGVIGGGGLGYEFYLSQQLLQHDDMLAFAILITVLVMITERISDFLRRKILGVDALK